MCVCTVQLEKERKRERERVSQIFAKQIRTHGGIYGLRIKE